MSADWYVCRIRPKQSTDGGWDPIVAGLERQGFASYMPVDVQTVYLHGRKAIVQTPLFPGYMFVAFDKDEQQWRRINSTSGVIHLLPMHAEIPSAVPTAYVSELKTHRKAAAMVEVTKKFMYDEVVRIIAGPFASATDDYRTGRVVSSGNNKTRVRLSDVNEIIASIPTAHLDAA